MSELPPIPREMPPEDFEGRVTWAHERVGELLRSAANERQAAVFSESLGKLVELRAGPKIGFILTRIFTSTREDGTYIKEHPFVSEPFQAYWDVSEGNAISDTFTNLTTTLDKNRSLESLVTILTAPDIEIIASSYPTKWVHRQK